MMPHHPSTPSAHTSDTITLNNSTVHNLPYFFSACVAGRRLPMLADEIRGSTKSTQALRQPPLHILLFLRYV